MILLIRPMSYRVVIVSAYLTEWAITGRADAISVEVQFFLFPKPLFKLGCPLYFSPNPIRNVFRSIILQPPFPLALIEANKMFNLATKSVFVEIVDPLISIGRDSQRKQLEQGAVAGTRFTELDRLCGNRDFGTK